jgi:hypothetical protein
MMIQEPSPVDDTGLTLQLCKVYRVRTVILAASR